MFYFWLSLGTQLLLLVSTTHPPKLSTMAPKSRRVEQHASNKAEANAISTDKLKLQKGKDLSEEWVLAAYTRLVNYTEKKTGLAKVTKSNELKAIVARHPILVEKIAAKEAPLVPHVVATPTSNTSGRKQCKAQT